jgi:hypothetical protein
VELQKEETEVEITKMKSKHTSQSGAAENLENGRFDRALFALVSSISSRQDPFSFMVLKMQGLNGFLTMFLYCRGV